MTTSDQFLWFQEKDIPDLVKTQTEVEASFFLDLTSIVWDYVTELSRTAGSAYPSYSCEGALQENSTMGGESATWSEQIEPEPIEGQLRNSRNLFSL